MIETGDGQKPVPFSFVHGRRLPSTTRKIAGSENTNTTFDEAHPPVTSLSWIGSPTIYLFLAAQDSASDGALLLIVVPWSFSLACATAAFIVGLWCFRRIHPAWVVFTFGSMALACPVTIALVEFLVRATG